MPRFTLDMDEKFDQTLTSLAEGGTKADVIRKAVASYMFLKSETSDPKAAKRIAITDADGKVEKNVILP